MTTLPKQYDPKISESLWQKKWEEMGVYAFHNDLPRAQTFVIDTPPPTVSGVLHMGHIFSYTQADFIARYKRMRGFDVFYPMGFDLPEKPSWSVAPPRSSWLSNRWPE